MVINGLGSKYKKAMQPILGTKRITPGPRGPLPGSTTFSNFDGPGVTWYTGRSGIPLIITKIGDVQTHQTLLSYPILILIFTQTLHKIS